MSQSIPTSPQVTQPNPTRPIPIPSSSFHTLSTINRIDRPEHGSLARLGLPTELASRLTLMQCRAGLIGKLSGDTLSSVKFRCDKSGEISQSKVRSAYMPMADFTLFPRHEKTREEKRAIAAKRYAIQRWNGTPSLSVAGEILRDKLIAATNNEILVAKQKVAKQDECEARAQAQTDSIIDKGAKRATQESKRQAELAEQAALLNSLGLTLNPDFAAAYIAQLEDDDDDAGFPNYGAAYPSEHEGESTGEQSESTGEEEGGE